VLATIEHDLTTIKAIPGVVEVTQTFFLPWQGGGSSGEVRPLGAKGNFLRTQEYSADDVTLKTLGIELISGRTFTLDDVKRDSKRLEDLFSGPRERNADGLAKEPFLQEVVVSKAFAKLAFGDEAAV